MHDSPKDKSTSEEVDAIISKYPDWRGERMSQIRRLIKQADPEVIEEVKFKKPSDPDGIPVWYDNGMICTGETYKNHLRIAFAKGPSLKDPRSLLNSYRAVLIHEEDTIDENAFKELVKQAVALNRDAKKPKS